MYSSNRIAALSLTLSFLLASAAQATNFESNQTSGNWSTAAHWTPSGPPGSSDTAIIGSNTQPSSQMTLNNGVANTVAELQIANVNTNSTGAILEVTGTGTSLHATGTGANSWISASNPGNGDCIGTLKITNSGSVQIDASTFNVASKQDNSNGHLILNNGTLTLAGNLNIVQGANTGGNFKVSNVTVNNGAVIDVNGGTGLTIGQTNNNATGSVNFNIDSTSRIAVDNDLILRGGANDSTTYLQQQNFAEYTLPLASTSAAGKFSIGRNLTLGPSVGGGGQTSRVVLEVDATVAKPLGQRADTNMSFSGSLGLSQGNSARSVLTINGATMDFAGNGNIDTADNAVALINLTNATLEATNLTLRSADAGAGSGAQISGTGTITATSVLRSDGSFVADGGNLVVQAGSMARNSGLNYGVVQLGGLRQAGWYAVNGGKLTLPGVTSFGSNRTWGGDPNTASNPYQLVNSVAFQNVTGSSATTLLGELFAEDHGSVPAGLINPIGIWDFSGPTFTSAEMLIRYDDVAAGGSEGLMKLWHYTGGAWVDITGTLNTTANTMLSTPFNSFSFFAIAEGVESAVPEPSTYALGLIGLAGLGLVAWRRKRGS